MWNIIAFILASFTANAAGKVVPITKVGEAEVNMILSNEMILGLIVTNILAMAISVVKGYLVSRSQKLDTTSDKLEELSRVVRKIEIQVDNLMNKEDLTKEDLLREISPHIKLAVLECLRERRRQ